MDLKNLTAQIRKDILKILYEQGGHLGSSMSTLEVIISLYFNDILKFDPKNPKDPKRDYFLLSNGHACPALYAVLAYRGFFPKSKISDWLKINTGLEGHPVKGTLPGIEISSGSLGMGLGVGLGIALGLKMKNKKNQVIVMMSDGEQQEGSTWEAVMASNHYKADNLTAVIDYNKIQINGLIKNNMKLEPLAKKYQSFGWKTIEINGHDFTQIKTAFTRAFKSSKPTAIISNTIPAKGVYKLEGRKDTHHPKISKKVFQKSIELLN